jgi:hypothetical protein
MLFVISLPPNAELTGKFSSDNGDGVDGYQGEFAGRTVGSRGAERRRTECLAGHPATPHSRGASSSNPFASMPLNVMRGQPLK